MQSDSVLISISPTQKARDAAKKVGARPVDGDILLCFEKGEGRHKAISKALTVDCQSRFIEIFFRAGDPDTLLRAISSSLSEACGFPIIAAPVKIVGTALVEAETDPEKQQEEPAPDG